MALPQVEQAIYFLDQAFDGNEEHSLLGNLRNVTPDDWAWRPEGGGRTIRRIAEHAGVAKFLYADHLFGDAALTYASVLERSPLRDNPLGIDAMIDWLRDGHRALRDGVVALTDERLMAPSRSHWGEMLETRWLLNVVIQHDVYHAGEINHVRALAQHTDRWPWEPS